MNWIGWSLVMFFSSVVLYLLVRKASLLQIPSQISNLAMFLLPLFVFAFLTASTGQNYSLSLWQYGLLIIAGILFSYIGNASSLKSIEYAPNPGYSLVLSKSYVVFTTIFSVLFFRSPLTLQKTFAIAVIVLFSALIMIGRTIRQSNILWLPLAFTAFFCWGFLTLTSRYLYMTGVPTLVFLTALNLIVIPCILIEMNYRKINYFASITHHFWIFLLIGIFSTSFNFGLMQAVNIAPNPGYVNAANAASISLVAIMAVLFFRDEFSLRKFVGILGVVIGLILLFV